MAAWINEKVRNVVQGLSGLGLSCKRMFLVVIGNIQRVEPTSNSCFPPRAEQSPIIREPLRGIELVLERARFAADRAARDLCITINAEGWLQGTHNAATLKAEPSSIHPRVRQRNAAVGTVLRTVKSFGLVAAPTLARFRILWASALGAGPDFRMPLDLARTRHTAGSAGVLCATAIRTYLLGSGFGLDACEASSGSFSLPVSTRASRVPVLAFAQSFGHSLSQKGGLRRLAALLSRQRLPEPLEAMNRKTALKSWLPRQRNYTMMCRGLSNAIRV